MKGLNVKPEPEDFQDQYQSLVVPSIRHSLLSSSLQDMTVWCDVPPSPVSTSSLLLAAISPWLRFLMEDAGDEFCLFLPSVTPSEFSQYLHNCLLIPITDGNCEDSVSSIHNLLLPKSPQITIEKVSSNNSVIKLEPSDISKSNEDEMDVNDYLEENNIDLDEIASFRNGSVTEFHDKDDDWKEADEKDLTKKKKRGRPRGKTKKNVDESDTDDNDEDWTEVSEKNLPEKKKRGRPKGKSKKYQDESDSDFNDKDEDWTEANEKDLPKIKKRGRPRGKYKKNQDKSYNFFACRYDPNCKAILKSFLKRSKHERCKHGAPYVSVQGPFYTFKRGHPVICHECGKEFSAEKIGKKKMRFLEHLRKHQVENFQCDCPETEALGEQIDLYDFESKERHMRIRHMGWLGCQEVSQDSLETCLYTCETEEEMENHKDLIHTASEDIMEDKPKVAKKKKWNKILNKKLLCPDCGKEFVRQGRSSHFTAEFERHQFKHVIENFSCSCPDVPRITSRLGQQRIGIEFKQKERHVKIEHMGWHGCKNCMQCFKTIEALTDHISKHNLRFVCHSCGFEALSNEKLNVHIKKAHESKDVPCPDCGKLYKEDYLKVHKKNVHNAVACKICGVVVKNLRLHLQGMHTADKDKRFRCEDCGKGFMCKIKLGTHRMNTHIKTQPHQCRYGCENRYNDVSNRNAHERRRHGQVFGHVG